MRSLTPKACTKHGGLEGCLLPSLGLVGDREQRLLFSPLRLIWHALTVVTQESCQKAMGPEKVHSSESGPGRPRIPSTGSY